MARKFNLQSFLIGKLRRLSYQTPIRSEAIKAARVARGLYRCNSCKETFHRGEFAVDHVQPVIHPKRGFVDWNEFISRLFCSIDGLQILCHSCHKAKTELENKGRLNGRREI